MDYFFYLFGVLVFVAIVLLVEGVYIGWNSTRGPEAKRIERRLRAMSAGGHGNYRELSIVKERMLSESPMMQRLLLNMPRIGALDRLLLQSGLTWSVAEFLGLSILASLSALIASVFFNAPFIGGLVFAGLAAVVPYLYAARAKTRRLVQLELQLPDALDLISRAMKAGHAFPTGLKMVADEMNDPIASEFGTAFDEVNFGISMQDALLNLATRIPSTDLRYFVIAVLIQRETGGNLSELLGNISSIVRARLKLLGQIRVLSAEGRLSAWVLCLLPFAAAFFINLKNPKYLVPLYEDPTGQRMLIGMSVAMLFGILWMRKIIRIRV